MKEELVEEIINGYLAKQLSESWWELIRNYGQANLCNLTNIDRMPKHVLFFTGFDGWKTRQEGVG